MDTMARPEVADQLQGLPHPTPRFGGLAGHGQNRPRILLLQRADQPNRLHSNPRRKNSWKPSRARARTPPNCAPPSRGTSCTCTTAWSFTTASRTASNPKARAISSEELQALSGRPRARSRRRRTNRTRAKPPTRRTWNASHAFFKRYNEVARFAYPLIIPPLPGQSRQAWSQHRHQPPRSRCAPGNCIPPTPFTPPSPPPIATTNPPNSTRPSPNTASGCRKTTLYPALQERQPGILLQPDRAVLQEHGHLRRRAALGLRLLDQSVRPVAAHRPGAA